MMKHTVQCQCGSVRGHIHGKGASNRVVCYCSDCRAFARFLGCPDGMLDAHGGTAIVHVAQPRLHLSRGKEQLAALRLTPGGMIRWYARCCNSPIGNTLANPRLAFLGVIEVALDPSKLDADFGTRIVAVNTASATGATKPRAHGLPGTMLRLLWILVGARVSARYRRSPLFDASGSPIVAPVALDAGRLAQLKGGG